MPLNYPIKFQPILIERIWGGNNLHKLLNKNASKKPIGETWEISTIPNHISIVANGSLKGKSILELIQTYKKDFLGNEVVEKYGLNFPLLIKFIDAHKDLSIQLHPNNDIAQKKHNSSGKEEMWYIIQAEKDSCLFLGFNQKVSKEILLKHTQEKTISNVLNREEPKTGDVFYIPPGSVHAIGKGIVLAEIQQASDITYRLYDWDRKNIEGKHRKLHTKLALEAINFEMPTQFLKSYKTKINHFSPLVDGNHFTTKIVELVTKKQIATTSKNSFSIYMCVEGKGTFFTADHEVPFSIGDCILIPASLKRYTIVPNKKATMIYIKAR